MPSSHGDVLPSVAIQHPYLHPDVVVYLDERTRFEPGTVTVGRAQDLRPGAGAYTGAMLHALGHAVRYFDRVGRDLFGDHTLEVLDSWGHDTTGVVRYDGDSQLCLSIADTGTLGGTMVITYPTAWQQTFEQARELIVAAEPEAHHTYLWSWFWSYAHQPLAGMPTRELAERAAHGSELVILDPNWKPAGDPPEHEIQELRGALQHVDVLKPNVRDARLLVGDRSDLVDIIDLPRRLLELGPEIVVITDGSTGCLVASRESNHVVRVPTPKVDVRDTTGAGDYFGGALLHAITAGLKPAEAAAFATAAAGLAISRPKGAELPPSAAIRGVAHGLLDRSETLA